MMGDQTDQISLYSTRTGKALSRGQVDFRLNVKEGTTMGFFPACEAQPREALLVAHGSEISPFLPH